MKLALSSLLVFAPLAVVLRHGTAEQPLWTFGAAWLAIVPLAFWLGRASEHLGARAGAGFGGLLDAAGGNLAALILAAMALRQGLVEMARASLAGAVLANLLLVLGAAMVGGGRRWGQQRFHATAAPMQTTALALAAIALVVPSGLHHLGGARVTGAGAPSLAAAGVLLATFALGLLFTRQTGRPLFSGAHGEVGTLDPPHLPWTLPKALLVFAAAAAAMAWMGAILFTVAAAAATAMGTTQRFVGIVAVAAAGSAAQRSSAIRLALSNRLDLALAVTVGSAIQLLLFVTPALVVASFLLTATPMDLLFSPAAALAIVATAAICAKVASDGESHWLTGVQLLAVYAMFALGFYLLPASGAELTAAPIR
jgi:Ca2+:H+ antiporter